MRIEEEHIVYDTKPPQVLNLKFYIFLSGFFLILTIVAIVILRTGRINPSIIYIVWGAILLAVLWMMITAFLQCAATRYIITNQRLRIKTGVFTRKTEEIELYRVKDISITEPFSLRIFGRGNIELITSDKTMPFVVLQGLENPDQWSTNIRELVERCRVMKGVREID